VSLDYVLLKPLRACASLAELVTDPAAGFESYQALAQKIWPLARWDHAAHGIAVHEGCSFEITISDSAVHIAWRGEIDPVEVISDVAERAARVGFVVVDIQTSELFLPAHAEASEYGAWYASVMKSTGG
jgi:hypothetical protein